MWFGANVRADSEIDRGRIRPLESADDVDRRVMTLDLGGLARAGPVFAVRPVGMLDCVIRQRSRKGSQWQWACGS